MAPSQRALSSEIQLLLAEIRNAVGGVAAVILECDREGGVLRVLWSEPDKLRQAVAQHPLSVDCTLARTLQSRRRSRGRGSGEKDCLVCRDLFGGRAVISTQATLGGERRAVVAAFTAFDHCSPDAVARAQRLAVHLGSFLALHIISQQAERRASELAVVNEIAANLTSVTDTEQLFPKILDEMRRVVHYDAANLFLFDPEACRLRIVANRGEPPERQRLREDTAWGRAAGRAFRTQQCVAMRDWRREAPEYGTPANMPILSKIRAVLCVPIVFGGESLGVISTSSRRPGAFSEEDKQLVTLLANHAAVAIANAQRYLESAAREKAKLEAIVESLKDGLVLVGTGGEAVYASQRFVDLAAWGNRQLLGVGISQVWGWLVGRCAAPGEAEAAMKQLEDDPSQPVVLEIAHPARRDLEVRCFAVSAPGGQPLGKGYLLRDVTHRTQVERLKASILSTVSHELRAPLAAIKGFATSLLRADAQWDEESKRDFIEQIDRESDRLSVLVRNILDMSRLDAGTLRLDREWCDLVEMVLDVVDRMPLVVANHQVDLAVGPEQVLAFVDRRYLERVIWNLVENAVNYSAPGSRITLAVANEDGIPTLSMRDQGIGLGQEDRERVFEPFYRVPGTRKPGVGLGLAICRGIVEAHGGSIAVESRLGEGSVFVVQLPYPEEIAPRSVPMLGS